MPVYRDAAVVLRTQPLGEADRIVTMLGRRSGLIRAVARGVRRTSSKFGARVEPCMVIDVQLFEGKTLDVVTQVEAVAMYGEQLSGDFDRWAAAMAIVETAERAAPDPSTSARLFVLVTGALATLAQGRHDRRLVVDAYLLRVLAMSGWTPRTASCVKCGEPGPHRAFMVAWGGTVCRQCRGPGAVATTPEAMQVMDGLLHGSWELPFEVPAGVRRDVSALTTAFVEWHIERGVSSLRMVEST